MLPRMFTISEVEYLWKVIKYNTICMYVFKVQDGNGIFQI